MEEIRTLCEECIGENLYQIIISKAKNPDSFSKVKVRPLLMKGELMYQVSEIRGTQIFHINLQKEELIDRLTEYLSKDFLQAEISTSSLQATVLISKKGRITILRKRKERFGTLHIVCSYISFSISFSHPLSEGSSI